jgi:hypothetical protein
MTITFLNNFTIWNALHKRIHFASTMTMTGNNEETIKDNYPSYLIMNLLK